MLVHLTIYKAVGLLIRNLNQQRDGHFKNYFWILL